MDDDSLKYKAIQTQQQIRAVCRKLDKATVISQIKQNSANINKIQRSRNFRDDDCVRWLKNSWNTERILRLSQEIVEQKGNYFALQWSFPQAYYSVFCSLQAYFSALNEKDKSHTATLNCYSDNILRGIYPKNMCFCLRGCKDEIIFDGLEIDDEKRTLELDESEVCSIDTRIGRFLRSTRTMILEEKKEQLIRDSKNHPVLLTKKFKASKKLNADQWRYISNKVESTTLLHLLYRKRIKSNYRDIDTFQYPGLRSDLILKDLIEVISYLNFVHEYLISKHIGCDKLKKYAISFDAKNGIEWFSKRILCIINNQ